MNGVVGLSVVMFAVLAQVAVVPAFSILGAQPDLVLVLLVAWMSVRGQRETLLLIPAAGVLQGLLDGQALGIAMLALAPLILLTEVRELRLVESDFVPALLITAVATLAYETVILVTLAVRGEHIAWLASVLDVLVPAAVANVLLLLPVYGLVRLGSVDLHRRRAF